MVGVTWGTGASNLFTVIDLFDKVNNDSSIDILDLLKRKDTGKTSDEKMLNKLMEKACNYTISSGSDLNKVIVDGGKKFRIMKVQAFLHTDTLIVKAFKFNNIATLKYASPNYA